MPMVRVVSEDEFRRRLAEAAGAKLVKDPGADQGELSADVNAVIAGFVGHHVGCCRRGGIPFGEEIKSENLRLMVWRLFRSDQKKWLEHLVDREVVTA